MGIVDKFEEGVRENDGANSIEIAVDALSDYGVTHAAYVLTSSSLAMRNDPIIEASYPDEWVDRYQKNSYHLIDPVVVGASMQNTPFCWSDVSKNSSLIRRFFDEASEFGIASSGVTIPIRDATGHHAVFALNSEMDPREWKHTLRGSLPEFFHLAMLYHNNHHAENDYNLANFHLVETLSAREAEVLEGAGRGETSAATAARIGVKESTVVSHLRRSFHKLGVSNKIHAVAVATASGLISPD